MPVFGGLTDQSLSLLMEHVQYVDVPANEHVFKQEDPAHSMFVIVRGRVAVLKTHKGHDYLLCYLQAGDCFGEMSLIDLQPRSASVLAVEACHAMEIHTHALHHLYKSNPEQYAMIEMNMGREVSRRLRAADQRLFEARVEADRTNDGYQFHVI